MVQCTWRLITVANVLHGIGWEKKKMSGLLFELLTNVPLFASGEKTKRTVSRCIYFGIVDLVFFILRYVSDRNIVPAAIKPVGTFQMSTSCKKFISF